MRPIRLALEGFTSFRDMLELDFTGLDRGGAQSLEALTLMLASPNYSFENWIRTLPRPSTLARSSWSSTRPRRVYE